MGDWSYLSSLLDKVQSHSTVVGKIWMSVLFLFRIFVLGAAADKVWGDELSEFSCDSKEPGCKHACYNKMFPISYIHYWVLQIIFVSTPTLVYLGHAVHVIHKEKRMIEQLRNSTDGSIVKKPKYTDDRGKVKITGVLFYTYMAQLFSTILMEVGFVVAQFYIYDSIFMVSYFPCNESPPCARSTGAQCYISRPTEKTIFVFFMLVVSGVSVLLNVVEMIYLMCNRSKQRTKKLLERQRERLTFQQSSSNPHWEGRASRYGGYPVLIPATNEEQHEDRDWKEKDT
ncbi:gap junction Cx32.2 protein-like [Xyrichtys novacula]|uniref:Gap junction Cx32.2 protein-like n=1 Tax=Xyrichtys novacula TaxID=13765 RepID=A0AAV1GYC9_XYRNO|nr:gap junction Cx32.2 protein-like [Xyrichtys novacula]